MTPMEAILGSPLKMRILRVLTKHPAREYTVRELARSVKASHVGTGKALDDLEAFGVVGRRRLGRAMGVSGSPDSELLREAARLFRAEDALRERAVKAVRRWSSERPDIVYTGFFGSYARGELGSTSDVDLLVVARNPKTVNADFDALRSEIHSLVGRPLTPLVLSPGEVARRRHTALLAAIRSEVVPIFRRARWNLP